jgi:hypothetical protein
MTNATIALPVVSYNGVDYATASLPQATISAFISRGLKHYLGNETASKVSAAKAKAQEGGNSLSDEDVANLKAEYLSQAIQAMNAGTVGESNRGPKLDPMEAEVARINKEEVVTKLRANGLHKGAKHPAGDAEYVLNGKTYTFDQFLEMNYAKRKSQIDKEAKAKLDRAARAAAAAKVPEGKEVQVEDLF